VKRKTSTYDENKRFVWLPHRTTLDLLHGWQCWESIIVPPWGTDIFSQHYFPSPGRVRVSGSYNAENQGDGSGEGATPPPQNTNNNWNYNNILFKIIKIRVRVSGSYSVENHRGGVWERARPSPEKNIILIITTYYFLVIFSISHFNAHPSPWPYAKVIF